MTLIDQCRDPYGPLSTSRKALLEQLLGAPDPALWEQARGLIIRSSPLVTLENAVKAVRKQANNGQTPDAFTLYRALRYALDYETRRSEPERGGICR